jgi:hypothetical protein
MSRHPHKRRPARALKAAIAAVGLAAVLAGCVQPRPAEDMWPNDPVVEFGPRWTPNLFTPENVEAFDGIIEVRRDYVNASIATVIENLDPDRPIAVRYVDRNDSQQLVQIGAGGTLAVAALPRRILSVRPAGQ